MAREESQEYIDPGFDEQYEQPHNDQPAEALPTTIVKVSKDGGITWSQRKVDFSADLNQSGLVPGEIFQLNGQKYITEDIDGELRVKNLKSSGKKRK